MAVFAESTQELGRDGVIEVKAWLESTTHIELGFSANKNRPVCTATLLGDKIKTFDLFGQIIVGGAPLYVEAKNYSSTGKQSAAFDEFLVTAYSATMYQIGHVEDARAEFMWVTTHPFALTHWSRLTSRTYLKEKVIADKTKLLPAGHVVDEDVLDLVSSRLWLLLMADRQRNELVLSREELSKVESVLLRKGPL